MKNIKIAAISDVHNTFQEKMPKGDILTVSGDLCFAPRSDIGEQQHHVTNFIRWCQKLLEDKIYKDIVFIPGNHDGYFEYMMLEKKEDEFRKGLPAHIHYLRDSLIEINGIKIFGSPWTPPFCNWWFNANEGQLDRIYSAIPEGVDIVLNHGPAFGMCDRIGNPYNRWGPEKLGSKALLKHIKRVKCLYSCFGHIHSGNHNVEEIIQENHVIKCVNVSQLDEDYQIAYKPFEFEINKNGG